MAALRQVRLLTKAPVPVPSLVLSSAVVGLADVLQQTPRAVTLAPPSAATFPPHAAVVVVIPETAAVVTVGVVLVVTLAGLPAAVSVKYCSLPATPSYSQTITR